MAIGRESREYLNNDLGVVVGKRYAPYCGLARMCFVRVLNILVDWAGLVHEGTVPDTLY